MIRFAFILAREAKVAQLDVLVLIQQYIFELQVAMDAGLLMHIRHSADQLGKGPLHLVHRESAMLDQVIIQFVTRTVLQDKPHQRLGYYNLVESRNMWMHELSVMVDFAGQVRIALVRGLEHDLGAIREFVGGQVDLSK
jgi:hypothetical protein